MEQDHERGGSRPAISALMFVGAMIVGLVGAAVVVPEREPDPVHPAEPAVANVAGAGGSDASRPEPVPTQLQAMLDIYAADVHGGKYDPQLEYICAADRGRFDPQQPFYAFEHTQPNFRDGVHIDAFDAVFSSKDDDVVRATVRTRSLVGSYGDYFHGQSLESTGYFRKEAGRFTLCPSAEEAF